MGVIDLFTMNVCLLCKWLWKIENEEGLWQQMIRAKYLHSSNLAHVKLRAFHSHFWSGILKVRDIFFKFCRKKIGNCCRTRFWDDTWIGEESLKDIFPRLYNISHSKNITVSKVFSEGWNTLKFRRNLWGELAILWYRLQELCAHVRLMEVEDRCVWTLMKSGIFSVRSLYNALKKTQVKVPYRKIWFVKTPLKIKIFLWLVFKKSILTKDVLLNRGWKGSEKCMFCSKVETIDHLFFECTLARYAWSVVACALNLRSVPRKF